jgi:hypothetical protein
MAHSKPCPFFLFLVFPAIRCYGEAKIRMTRWPATLSRMETLTKSIIWILLAFPTDCPWSAKYNGAAKYKV